MNDLHSVYPLNLHLHFPLVTPSRELEDKNSCWLSHIPLCFWRADQRREGWRADSKGQMGETPHSCTLTKSRDGKRMRRQPSQWKKCCSSSGKDAEGLKHADILDSGRGEKDRWQRERDNY